MMKRSAFTPVGSTGRRERGSTPWTSRTSSRLTPARPATSTAFARSWPTAGWTARSSSKAHGASLPTRSTRCSSAALAARPCSTSTDARLASRAAISRLLTLRRSVAALLAVDREVVVLDDHVVAVDRHVGDLVDEQVVAWAGADQLEAVHVCEGVPAVLEAFRGSALRDARDMVGVAGDRSDHASAWLEVEPIRDVVAV